MEVEYPERDDFTDEVKDFEAISEGSDDDDPVIEELDVHISGCDEAQFMIMQYPLRPIYRPYGDEGQLQKVEYRPEQKAFRMEYSLMRDDASYDAQHEFAEKNSHTLISRSVTAESAHAAQNTYALGFIKDGKLILTPVSHIAQLRPDYTHVDEKRKVVAQGGNAPEAEQLRVVNEEEMDDQVQAVEVTFKRLQKTAAGRAGESANGHASTGSAMMRRETYMRMRQMEQHLPWKRLHTYDEDSIETSEVLEFLLDIRGQLTPEQEVPQVEEDEVPTHTEPIKFVHSPLAYLDALSAVPKGQGASGPMPNVLSAATLGKLPLDQQVQRVLTQLHVVRHDRIKALVTKQVSDEELIALCSEFALNILGVWVVKSELVAEGYLALCRDLVILLLHQRRGQSLDRNKVSVATKLQHTQLKALLEPIAIQDGPVWRFKQNPDADFEAKWPEVVAANDAMLASRKSSLLMEIVNRQKEGQHERVGNEAAIAAAQTGEAATAGVAGDLAKYIKDALTGNACTAEECHKKVSEFASANAASDRAYSLEEVTTALQSMAHEIRGVFVLKKGSVEALEPARNVVISIFKQFAAASKDQVVQELTAVLGASANLPDVRFRHLLREMAVPMGGVYVFKAEASLPDGGASIVAEARQVLNQTKTEQ